MKASFRVGGKLASGRDLAEALALARQHVAKVAQADREAAQRDADARRVGAAIRRQRRLDIEVWPASVSGSRRGGVRLRTFEGILQLLMPLRASKVGADGRSSFHLKFTPRGLGGKRRAKDRPYTPGEAVQAVRYILRDAAREIEGGGIVSNISQHPDIVAGLFAALEELEISGGRANANVYMSSVVSLPHELTAAEREKVLTDICRPLAALGLPYVAVLHDPDPEGDPRNNHAHIMFSWRPFEHRPDGFAFSSTTLGALNTAEFVTPFRQTAAAAMNSALAATGHSRRFTAEKLVRSAPAKEGSAKHTPGFKHRRRRSAGAERAIAEKSWLEERAHALANLRDVTQAWLIRGIPDRASSIEAARARERQLSAAGLIAAEVAAAEPAAAPLPASSRPNVPLPNSVAVSHAKPIAVVAPRRLSPQPLPARVPMTDVTPPSIISSKLEPTQQPGRSVEPLVTDLPSRNPIRPVHDQGELHERSRHHHLAAVEAARHALAIQEPDHIAAEPLAATGSLASVRGLSSLGLVRDLDHLDVLLHRLPPVVVEIGREGGGADAGGSGGAGVRREGESDRDLPSQGAGVSGAAKLIDKSLVAAKALPTVEPERPAPSSPTTQSRLPAVMQKGRLPRQSKTTSVRESARAVERKAMYEALSALPFLPLRPVDAAEHKGNERSFTLVPENAAANDLDMIRKARKFEADDEFQRLFAERWEALLTRLRAGLTTGRSTRPPPGSLRWLVGKDERFGAALSVVIATDDGKEVLAEARRYWAERSQPQPEMPVAKTETVASAASEQAPTEKDDLAFLNAVRAARDSRSR